MSALTASVCSCVPVCVQTRGRSYCRTARYCQDGVAHISQCCNRFVLVHVAEWGIPVSEVRLSSTSVSRFAHAKERTEPLRESKPRHLFLRLTQSYQVFNLASGGATIDAALVAPFQPTVLSVHPSLADLTRY